MKSFLVALPISAIAVAVCLVPFASAQDQNNHQQKDQDVLLVLSTFQESIGKLIHADREVQAAAIKEREAQREKDYTEAWEALRLAYVEPQSDVKDDLRVKLSAIQRIKKISLTRLLRDPEVKGELSLMAPTYPEVQKEITAILMRLELFAKANLKDPNPEKKEEVTDDPVLSEWHSCLGELCDVRSQCGHSEIELILAKLREESEESATSAKRAELDAGEREAALNQSPAGELFKLQQKAADFLTRFLVLDTKPAKVFSPLPWGDAPQYSLRSERLGDILLASVGESWGEFEIIDPSTLVIQAEKPSEEEMRDIQLLREAKLPFKVKDLSDLRQADFAILFTEPYDSEKAFDHVYPLTEIGKKYFQHLFGLPTQIQGLRLGVADRGMTLRQEYHAKVKELRASLVGNGVDTWATKEMLNFPTHSKVYQALQDSRRAIAQLRREAEGSHEASRAQEVRAGKLAVCRNTLGKIDETTLKILADYREMGLQGQVSENVLSPTHLREVTRFYQDLSKQVRAIEAN